MDNPVMKSLLKMFVRRGLSMLGAAGAAVSDEWVTQTVSLLIIGINEGVNWYLSLKKEQQKQATVKVGG